MCLATKEIYFMCNFYFYNKFMYKLQITSSVSNMSINEKFESDIQLNESKVMINGLNNNMSALEISDVSLNVTSNASLSLTTDSLLCKYEYIF